MADVYLKQLLKGLLNKIDVEFDPVVGHDHDGVNSKQIAGGGGDMLKSIYDPDDDGVIALAQLDSDVISVAELIIALAGKSDVGHGHAEADVTNLVNDLAGKLAASAFSGLSKISVAATAPASPTVNDLWVDIS
jgi:hypothetical protein